MKPVFAFLIFFLTAVTLSALPKVAVLEAIVTPEVDQAVVRPVTDKVNEGFVNSGRYTVVARRDLDAVYKEKELQKGWDVTEQDAAATGQVVGADYVVVTRIDRLEDTYTLSMKLIEVRSAIIINQQSNETQGRLANLLQLARDLGRDLAAGQTQLAAPTNRRTSSGYDDSGNTPAPSSRRNQPSSGDNSEVPSPVRIVVDYSFCNMYGELYDALKKSKKYPQATFSSSNGLEMYIAANLTPEFYISGELDTYDYKIQDNGKKYTLFNVFNAYFGLGLSSNLSKYVRINYGGFIGSSQVTLKQTSETALWDIQTDGKSEANLGYGAELGIDLCPTSFFLINARIRAGFANFDPSGGTLASDALGTNVPKTALNFIGVSLGAGFSF